MSEVKGDLMQGVLESKHVLVKNKFTPKKSVQNLNDDNEDFGNEPIKDWLPAPHPKIKDDDDIRESYGNEIMGDWLTEDRKKFEGQLRRTFQSGDGDDKDDYSGEQINEWLTEDSTKKHLVKNKFTPKKSSQNLNDDNEDFGNEPIKEWLPAPHPKIKDDDDMGESFENEVIGEWAPENEHENK